MKRVVAYVSELGPQETSAAGLEMQSGNGCAPCSVANLNAVRIEAIISERQLKRLLAILSESATSDTAASTRREFVQGQIESAGPDAADLLKRILEPIERELIEQVFASCNGVQVRAAARLGIDRNSLRNRLRTRQTAVTAAVQQTD